MSGPVIRTHLMRLSFALSLATSASLASGCASDAPTTGGDRSRVDSAEDDDDESGENEDDSVAPEDDEAPSAPKMTDAGKRDAGAPASADAGKPDGGPTASGDARASGSSSAWCHAFAVLDDACGSCHGAQTAAGAPMPLASYEDLLADAPVTAGKKVYEVVQSRMHDAKRPMPPNGQLSADKLAAIDAWIEAGAEGGDDPSCSGTQGDETETPPQEWPPEGCTVYKILAGNGQQVSVPAGQETHPQFVFDAPWGNKQVQAIGFRPITDNSKVLHHWILYDTGTSAFLTGWAPGQDDADLGNLPPDVGMYLPKGSGALRLDMHYNNLQGTSAEPDESGVEICVTEQLRKHSSSVYMGFAGIPVIPAGTEMDVVGVCDVSITQPVFLLSESPHAHKLATHMKFEVVRGSERFMLRDEPFAFDAQVARGLPEPFELKNGDQVITTCHFKNDTNELVTFGENTGNEMCFNFASYYPMGALNCGLGLGGDPLGLGGLLGL